MKAKAIPQLTEIPINQLNIDQYFCFFKSGLLYKAVDKNEEYLTYSALNDGKLWKWWYGISKRNVFTVS